MGLIVYHAANEPARAARMLGGEFTAEDEEQLDVHTPPGVWCSSTVYPWAGLRDGCRLIIPHILRIELACDEAALEAYVDLENHWPSGSYWVPHQLLREHVTAIVEIDPSVLGCEAFWESWKDWHEQQQAVVALDNETRPE